MIRAGSLHAGFKVSFLWLVVFFIVVASASDSPPSFIVFAVLVRVRVFVGLLVRAVVVVRPRPDRGPVAGNVVCLESVERWGCGLNFGT